MKLSVVMPVYNGMPYVKDAVDSVLSQTFKEFRFIIINDGSTDGSAEYLDSIKDGRVTVIHQENRGLGAVLNRSLEICNTEYCARMDADDVSLPNRLQSQLRFIQEHDDLVLLGTQVKFIAGKRLFKGPIKPLSDEKIRKALMKGNAALCHGASLFKVDAARKAGGYRIKGGGEDIDFFLRMCDIGNVGNLTEILYLIRIHDRSINYVARNDVTVGRMYAIECARCREQGIEEPSFGSFLKSWENRSLFRKALDLIDGWSAVTYRRSLLDRGNGREILGLIRLGCAAACRPHAVMRRVLEFFEERRK